MARGPGQLVLRSKAVLCVLLTLNPFLWSGCGQPGLLDAPAAAAYEVSLGNDHPLVNALANSAFADATGFSIFPLVQQFRLKFRDQAREVVGQYAFVNGEFTILGFSFAAEARTVNMNFSESKQIMRIAVSDGAEWVRPAETTSAAIVPDGTGGVDAYLAANADVLEIARDLDARSADGKGDNALVPLLAGVLLFAVALWGPGAGVMRMLFTIFTVSVILQAVLVFRFDGNWTVTNDNSTLRVTIEGGRITRLVDEASNQELAITRTELQDVSGNNVEWEVVAELFGQEAPVEFQFDVQERADGQLHGSLTAIGSSLGRVPIVMTRV